MKRFILLIVLLSLVLPAGAFAIGLEVGLGVWRESPDGYVSYKPLSSLDYLDVKDDLNYDTESKMFGRVKIDMPLIIPNIYLMGTKSKFSGDGVKNVNFNFGGKTFNASVPFSSSVQLDHYDIALYYGIPGLKTLTLGILNIEIGLNARIIDFEAKVNQPSSGLYASKSATIPLPMVYAGIQVKPVSKVSVEIEGRGVAYSSNHYYDIIGRLKIKPLGPVFIAGGYRHEDLKVDYSDIEAETKIKGPFIEAGVEF